MSLQACVIPSAYSRIQDAKGRTIAILRLKEIVSARIQVYPPLYALTNVDWVAKVAAYGVWDAPEDEKRIGHHLEITLCDRGTFRTEQLEMPDFISCTSALDKLLTDLRIWEEYTTAPTFTTSLEHFEEMKNKL
jgi:hypothetical protein